MGKSPIAFRSFAARRKLAVPRRAGLMWPGARWPPNPTGRSNESHTLNKNNLRDWLAAGYLEVELRCQALREKRIKTFFSAARGTAKS